MIIRISEHTRDVCLTSVLEVQMQQQMNSKQDICRWKLDRLLKIKVLLEKKTIEKIVYSQVKFFDLTDISVQNFCNFLEKPTSS